jgi:hypothetical protein
MTDVERDAFLDEPGVILHLATSRADGSGGDADLFIYEEGAIWFTPRASQWLGDLRAIRGGAGDRRAAAAVPQGRDRGPRRAVFDLGKDDAWRDRYRRIACRYVAPDAAEAYVQNTIDQPRALFRVPLAGSTVRTWRMPVGDEPGDGIWHRRYYGPGTKMAGR